jgi:hypothetical protein
MKKLLSIATVSVLLITACKKQNSSSNSSATLYPLAAGNKWVYVDSFFEETGSFYALDTFALKTAQPVVFNSHSYTPITNQFDDSIFILQSTDSTVFMLRRPGEPLLFRSPLNQSAPTLTNSYPNNSLTSVVYTQQITSTNYPCYKILVTQDDGQRTHYRQQELFFTPGIGIIKGRDIRKTSAGNLYAFDSYKLIAYSLY